MNIDVSIIDRLPVVMDRLRYELRQYGEMLLLLDQQQESVIARSAAEVLRSVAAINAQMGHIHAARAESRHAHEALALVLGQEKAATWETLLPALPDTYRPAVAALVQENDRLLQRVQLRARQNHLLLSRSVELMHRFIESLMPMAAPLTGNDKSRLEAAPSPDRSARLAAGVALHPA